jgi:hypothetical protein
VVQGTQENRDKKRRDQTVRFKIHAAGGGLFLDLRPYASEPRLFERPMVELGAPFRTDDWGPTLWLRLGDRAEMDAMRGCLPRTELSRIAAFARATASLFGAGAARSHLETTVAQIGFRPAPRSW